MEQTDEMQKLIAEINEHNKNYYVLDNPTISDADYDKLYNRLLSLEKETGVVLPNSPSQRVGGDVLSGFAKYEHKARLFSLDKCQSKEELCKWIDDIKKEYPDVLFTLEYKFDGLSIVVEYENGFMKSAGTRGNGFVGEDVTLQAKTIKSIPLEIPFKGHVIVQGEGMITLSNLEKYNNSVNEPLKNARNAVAGAIRNLDPKETAKRNLDLFAYSINYIDGEKISSQQDVKNFLVRNGFKTSDYFVLFKEKEDLLKEIDKIDKSRFDEDILMDGLVIKINQYSIREELGATAKFPRWAMAFKFPPQEVTSKLCDVVWQVGRTGKLTPIAVIDPVELAGATVTRATLNNMGDIQRKGVKIGSYVFVRRSNEVIPEILSIARDQPNSKEITPPTICPVCGEKLVEKGANLFCPNKTSCRKQCIDKMVHFASKEGFDIEGLSDKTISLLNEKLALEKVDEIFDLKYDDLLCLESFKEKKSDNLINAIEKSKQVSFNKFLFALGIANVGTKTAKDLAKNFKTLDQIQNATKEELVSIDDVGDIVADSIFDFFQNENNKKIINNLFEKGVKIVYSNSGVSEIFAGKKFVLTGTLPTLSRQDATKIIEDNGGVVSSSVSKETDFLLLGENPGSKYDKAVKLGIKQISEQDLLSLTKK